MTTVTGKAIVGEVEYDVSASIVLPVPIRRALIGASNANWETIHDRIAPAKVQAHRIFIPPGKDLSSVASDIRRDHAAGILSIVSIVSTSTGNYAPSGADVNYAKLRADTISIGSPFVFIQDHEPCAGEKFGDSGASEYWRRQGLFVAALKNLSFVTRAVVGHGQRISANNLVEARTYRDRWLMPAITTHDVIAVDCYDTRNPTDPPALSAGPGAKARDFIARMREVAPQARLGIAEMGTYNGMNAVDALKDDILSELEWVSWYDKGGNYLAIGSDLLAAFKEALLRH